MEIILQELIDHDKAVIRYVISAHVELQLNYNIKERKRFLAKSKGCRDEDAISLVRNVDKQEGTCNMEW